MSEDVEPDEPEIGWVGPEQAFMVQSPRVHPLHQVLEIFQPAFFPQWEDESVSVGDVMMGVGGGEGCVENWGDGAKEFLVDKDGARANEDFHNAFEEVSK